MKINARNRIICMVLVIMMLLFGVTFPVMAAGSSDAQKKTVRVPCGINNALYLDDNGKPTGYLSYYIQQLAYINNWQLEYVEGSWNESVQNLYDGKIDVLFPTQKSEERKETMAFSRYIGGYQPIALYANEDAEIYYNDYEFYNEKRIAVSEGSSNETLLERYAEEHDFTYTAVYMDSASDKLEALKNGTVDMIVFSTLNDVPDSKIVCLLDYLPFYFCTRIEDTDLMTEINNGINSIMSDNPNVASDVFETVLKGNTNISYTREENETILKTDKVRVAMYDNALPLCGRDDDGNPIGIYIDLLKSIEEKAGIEIEPILISRDENLYSKMDDGTVDFVLGTKGLAYNEDDVSKYMCSESIMDYYTVAITRSDFNFEETDAPVFVLTRTRGYWEDEIRKEFPNAIINYCSDLREALAIVQSGEADVTLANTWQYNYQSKNSRFSGMMEWESLRKKSDLVLGVKKGTDMTLLSIMEKAIDQVAGEDKDAIIVSNLNIPYNNYTFADYWYSIKYTVIAGTVIFLILLFGTLYFWKTRRKHTLELEKKNEQLEESNNTKTNFLSRMSHELRTPLNALEGYTELTKENIVADHPDTDYQLQNLTHVQEASKYLLRIIDDILDMQDIKFGKITIKKAPMEVEKYIGIIFDEISKEAKERGIHFSLERLTKLNEVYMIDDIRCGQVIMNVLHNAVKFTPSGGTVSMTVEAKALEDNWNEVKVVVSDTGIGMSQEFMDNKLFTEFAQEDQGLKSSYEGCGTGMALCKELLELMDGTISCTSEKGKGSVFTITIKVEAVKEKKMRHRVRAKQPSYDLSGVKVLLFEDNPMNQDMEKRILEKMQCEVDIAEDGQIGLVKFIQSDVGYYNMILMDLRMPNMDGLEATIKIRELKREDAKTIPILAVSANAFDEDIKASLDAGMNEHLAKPVSANILYEKIKQYCGLLD